MHCYHNLWYLARLYAEIIDFGGPSGARGVQNGAKIEAGAPFRAPRTSPCGVECCMLVNSAPAGMLGGTIFDDFVDLGSILWMVLGRVLVHFGFRHAAIPT